MKTLFNTALKSTSLAIVLLASAFTMNATAATITVDRMNDNQDIKKVIVTGNTKVMLVQDEKDYITMDEADMPNVSVKQVGHTLTIASSEFNPVTVTVHVKDLYRIDASGKANVQTAGKFNVKFLQVLLKDDARARVKATTESLYTVVDGAAKLELIGTTGNHIYKLADIAKMDTDKFAALTTEYEAAPEKAIASNMHRKVAVAQ